VVEELADRYGEPPAEVAGLVEVARLRRRAAQSQLADVVAMGKNLRVAPAHLADSMQVRLKRLYPGAKILANGDALVVPMPTAEGIDIVAWARQLLDAIYPLPKVES
jgi:transcription-repair coupling factor (superfamily II helicase)